MVNLAIIIVAPKIRTEKQVDDEQRHLEHYQSEEIDSVLKHDICYTFVHTPFLNLNMVPFNFIVAGTKNKTPV